MRFNTGILAILAASYGSATAQNVSEEKIAQLNAAARDTNGQIDTTDNGARVNTSYSLRAGPRGYNLLEDTSVRKKMLHFDRERAPERVVHALGHGAYGTFESYGDFSNITNACSLQEGAVSEVFARFSVVVASVGGAETGRDTHGFATRIYSDCGNQDFVGNHLSSFFINDGANFPDLIHAVKYEADKGFPTGGTAHRTAYDFFNQHPEGAFQLMNVLSDLGIPRDTRHISGNGHRSLVYDEATKIAGKNNNFQRIDLYNNIAAGNFPEWELAVQLFPDEGSYTWNGYDLLIPTVVVPFEVNPPIKMGKLRLDRNPSNFFAEPESISFAPGNVVDGVSFVPDPLLQWRLMSYDDTSTHRHGSPNGYTLPINRPIAPVNNNYRDGYMQPYIFQGDSISTPNDIGGLQEADFDQTLTYTASTGEMAGPGVIGRYSSIFDWFGQARGFWNTLDLYAKQHTVDAYVFELGNVGDAAVVQKYITETLNNIDNCLARRVAFAIAADMPAPGSGWASGSSNDTTTYPSYYPLVTELGKRKSNEGLQVAIIANDTLTTTAEVQSMTSLLSAEGVTLTVVAPRIGSLQTGVDANASFITTSDIFFDAVFIGSLDSPSNDERASGLAGYFGSRISENATAGGAALDQSSRAFLMEAYSHGKAIGIIGGSSGAVLRSLGVDNDAGVYTGSTASVTEAVLDALAGPVRFPERFPTNDVSAICV